MNRWADPVKPLLFRTSDTPGRVVLQHDKDHYPMKLKAEVLAVASQGETIKVDIQASGAADAEWRDMKAGHFHVADIERNRKTFTVGRQLEIEIRPL